MAPQECIAVEDSDNGLRAALDAGIRAVLVTVCSYTASQRFPGASLVTDGFGEPDAPVRALAGDLAGAACVDLDLLDRMHARAYPCL